MIDCPLQNTALTILGIGFQVRSRDKITQKFGENKVSLYKQLGMKGHNGIDFGVPMGTPVYAPFDGFIKCIYHETGYGIHVRIRNHYKALECVLGHLYTCNEDLDGTWINQGDVIGYTGNTGSSTGPHLHYGVRKLNREDKLGIWELSVRDYNNGYYGYYDFSSVTKEWKGTLTTNNL